MKENNFKFRESFSEAVRVMNDKKAGKFIKAVCNYAFDKVAYNGKDKIIKSAFSLVKVALDNEKLDKLNGRYGGKISAELRRKKQGEHSITTVISNSVTIDEILKDALESYEKYPKKANESTQK